MITTFFPRPYSDEILYSVLARFARTSGITERQGSISQIIFGAQGLVPVVLLPRRLTRIASVIPPELNIDAKMLLNHHTLYNYLLAFETNERRIEARNLMMDSHPLTKPIAIGQLMPAIQCLRYCSSCNKASVQNPAIQEMYWHRKHQLPGIDVCPVHGSVLRLSEVRIGTGGGVHYRAATSKLCPENSARLACPDDPSLLAELREIGSRALRYLDSSAITHDPYEKRIYIRQRLLSAGLTDRNNVARTAAMSLLQERWPRTFEHHSHLAKPGHWLGDVLLGSKTRNSVPAHVMVDIWLSELNTSGSVKSTMAENDIPIPRDNKVLRKRMAFLPAAQLVLADKELRRKTEIAVRTIQSAHPYKRVTIASLAREMDNLLIVKKRYRQRWPLTAKAIDKDLETTEQYLTRIATTECDAMHAEGVPLFLNKVAGRLRLPRNAIVTRTLKKVIATYTELSENRKNGTS